MHLTLKAHACRAISVATVLAAGLFAGWPVAPLAAASGAMPVLEQNQLVQKYCAVCHTDAHPNGGLSLQHFDAAHPDPGVAAMMASKLRTGAIGAAGMPAPDKTTQDALLSALSAEGVGSREWVVNRAENPTTKAPILTASVVRSAPSAAFPDEPDLYRLKLTCQADTHEGEMQLAWSPAVPPTGQVMSAAVDGQPLLTYKVEGTEKMGNGSAGSSGPGSTVLRLPLPRQTLTLTNLFPGETVVFPFDSLTQPVREALSTCFTGTGAGQ